MITSINLLLLFAYVVAVLGVQDEQVGSKSVRKEIRRKPSSTGVAGHHAHEHQENDQGHDHNQQEVQGSPHEQHHHPQSFSSGNEQPEQIQVGGSNNEAEQSEQDHKPKSFSKNPSSQNQQPVFCPDGSDSLQKSVGEMVSCGTGSDGHELCPLGFYCSIDVERNSRLCCPLSSQASQLPHQNSIGPQLGNAGGEVVRQVSEPNSRHKKVKVI